MISVAVAVLGLLVAAATLAGLLLDRANRNAAWLRIATARRVNGEIQRDLETRMLALHVEEERLRQWQQCIDAREQRRSRDGE